MACEIPMNRSQVMAVGNQPKISQISRVRTLKGRVRTLAPGQITRGVERLNVQKENLSVLPRPSSRRLQSSNVWAECLNVHAQPFTRGFHSSNVQGVSSNVRAQKAQFDEFLSSIRSRPSPLRSKPFLWLPCTKLIHHALLHPIIHSIQFKHPRFTNYNLNQSKFPNLI